MILVLRINSLLLQENQALGHLEEFCNSLMLLNFHSDWQEGQTVEVEKTYS